MNPPPEAIDAGLDSEIGIARARPPVYSSMKVAGAGEELEGLLREFFGYLPVAPSGTLSSLEPQTESHKPAFAYLPETPASRSETQKVHETYRERISQLREDGEEDGVELREESRIDFWEFFNANPRYVRGGICMHDDGNLCAIWRDGSGTRLSLNFLGSGEVEYVIFKKRQAATKTSRVAARTSLDGIRGRIDEFGLQSLLCP